MEKKPDYSACFKKISAYCVARERSIREVKEKLLSWTTDEDQIDQIIKVLSQENFINENRYAENFVIDKFKNHNWGKNKIREHLEYQNIKSEIIEKSLTLIPIEEYKNMAALLIRKSRNAKTVYLTLMSKGYEEDLVKELLYQAGITEIQ